jgi:hypothetical protein
MYLQLSRRQHPPPPEQTADDCLDALGQTDRKAVCARMAKTAQLKITAKYDSATCRKGSRWARPEAPPVKPLVSRARAARPILGRSVGWGR